MGTTKFPDENDYNVYLSSHGGSSNAFTDMESTNYYFDVSADHLEGAVDRFAQFFIAPLFNKDSNEREMQAVDSEHAKNLQNDAWRMFQLSKSLCRKDHPFCKFGSGNLKTLKELPEKEGLDIRAMLLDFHEKYYSANVMKLVLLGKESIDELCDMAEKYFVDVKNQDINIPTFPGTPFGSDELCKRLDVVPVRDGVRTLEIQFPMREIESLYLFKPARYLSHLIGHEGNGSILALLKKRGLANELSSGESRSCSDWSSFCISIELTDNGLAKVDEVVEIVFSYISLLQTDGVQKWIHDETATVASCQFRFLSKRNPMDYVCSLAGRMQIYPDNHVLSGPYKIYEYDPQLIEELLKYFTVENMIMFVSSKQFEGMTQEKEEWYGTEYNIENIAEDLKERWSNSTVKSDLIVGELKLPEMNDMIADDFSLKDGNNLPKDKPKLLSETEKCRLWYKPDNVFDMPKVNIMALLCTSAAASTSAVDSVLSTLYTEVLQEHTNDFTYLASMASLHSSIHNNTRGIELSVSGYSQKAHILLKRLVDAMTKLPAHIKEPLFDRMKDKLMKQYQNFLFAQPYQHAFFAADLCLENTKWSIEEKMMALQAITIQDVIDFSRRLLKRFHLEVLVHGNVSSDEAKQIADIILNEFEPEQPFSSTLPEMRVVQLDNGKDYTYRFEEPNPENTNSSIVNIYQVGRVNLHDNAILAFLHHILKEPAFNELRTNEQLGYIVHTSVKTNGDDIKGLLFLIQSDSFDPVHLDSRIEAFIERLRPKIVSMTEEEYQANIAAVCQTLREKNKNIGEETSKYWNVINNNTYMFKRLNLIADEVEKVQREQLLDFFDKYLGVAESRKKMSVQVFAKQHMEKYEEPTDSIVVKDVSHFKRSAVLYGLPEAVDLSQYIM